MKAMLILNLYTSHNRLKAKMIEKKNRQILDDSGRF